MLRRYAPLMAVFSLVVAIMSPLTASAEEATLEVTDSGITVVGEAEVAADVAKGDAGVEIDVGLIEAATTSARAAAAEAAVALDPDGFIAQGLPSVVVTFDAGVDADSLAAAVGGEVLAEYSTALTGAALVLPESELENLAKMPGITGVFPNELHQLETEVSPDFVDAPGAWDEVGGSANAGDGVVVGVIDTGIWPEHPSFADDGTYNAPPASWTGANCDFGNTVYNEVDAPFTCNNKLIGATYAMPAYAASGLLLPGEFKSARDDNGHGTHTASTAAGNYGVSGSIFGIPRGVISGIAPHAHVAAYKACGDEGCFTSDLILAIDSAVADGVDVINYSIGGGQSDPYTDPDAAAFLNAYDQGVFVATSAGNSGPAANTLGSPGDAPWITTVGASTSDRHFISTVTLSSDTAADLVVEGASVTAGAGPLPVVMADSADTLCLESASGVYDYSGSIVVCERGEIARVAKSFNAAQQGAAGMFLFNADPAQGLATDNHFIPSVHMVNSGGLAVIDYVTNNTNVTASFTMGESTEVLGDMMAAFSSRGGDGYLTIKPDITAPGVQILAGHTPLPATVEGGLPGELFQSIQGTSMSAPHVAGAGAVLAQMHPDWTPGQIKSALMMGSEEDGIVKEDGSTPSDPFDRGAGRLDVDDAGAVGLTISETGDGFLAAQGHEWDANIPSLWFPVMPGKIAVERTVHNETNRRANWKLTVNAPSDVSIDVPHRLRVPANGDATFEIEIDARRVPLGEIRFAEIEFKKGNQRLTFPIAFKRDQAGVTMTKTCDPSEIKQWESTTCTITVENTTFEDASVTVKDWIPWRLWLDRNSVVGADASWNRVEWDGTLFGATPAFDVVESTSPFGYVPLSNFAAPFDPPSNPDDGAWILSGLDFIYDGVAQSSVIWSVNGTLEAGTASGVAASGSNTALPNPGPPNNLMAPWWTDLDLTAAGDWYVASLTDGVNDYTVFEWENVPRFGDTGSTFTFQIWIQDGTSNIWYVYDSSAGNLTGGTAGAENVDGTIGSTHYYNGSGTIPWGGSDLGVVIGTGAPGETHTITFNAKGVVRGNWTNWAYMTSDSFAGTSIAGASGKVLRGTWKRSYDAQ